MFSRSQFEQACRGLIEKHSRSTISDGNINRVYDNWLWVEHPVCILPTVKLLTQGNLFRDIQALDTSKES